MRPGCSEARNQPRWRSALLRRRPSAAIVISSAALLMSLGGVGYAAITLPAHSVGNAQLQNGSVSFMKIRPNSVGHVRANIDQLQERVNGTCAAGSAIGAINKLGRVICNPALPSEFGTTSNSTDVANTATTVASTLLPAGPTYLAFANPMASVTSGAASQHVTVSCTLTVGSNMQTRAATIDTDGTANDVSTASIPLQTAGPAGATTVSCESSTAGTGTAPNVTVTSAINALQTSSNN